MSKIHAMIPFTKFDLSKFDTNELLDKIDISKINKELYYKTIYNDYKFRDLFDLNKIDKDGLIKIIEDESLKNFINSLSNMQEIKNFVNIYELIDENNIHLTLNKKMLNIIYGVTGGDC